MIILPGVLHIQHNPSLQMKQRGAESSDASCPALLWLATLPLPFLAGVPHRQHVPPVLEPAPLRQERRGIVRGASLGCQRLSRFPLGKFPAQLLCAIRSESCSLSFLSHFDLMKCNWSGNWGSSRQSHCAPLLSENRGGWGP